jgi:hypothetical protein
MEVSEKTLDFIGASEGIRTLDIHVGNVTLYQTELRSLPNGYQVTNSCQDCKQSFTGCRGAFKLSFFRAIKLSHH